MIAVWVLLSYTQGQHMLWVHVIPGVQSKSEIKLQQRFSPLYENLPGTQMLPSGLDT